MRFSRITVYAFILLIAGIIWFLPWYPPTGAGQFYSSGVISLEPTGGSPKELGIILLPAGSTMTAKVTSCEKCFIGIWNSDGAYVLGTYGSTTSEFVVTKPGGYMLVGGNSDTETQRVEVSLTVPRTSPFDVVAKFGVVALVLILPFALGVGLLFEMKLLMKLLQPVPEIPGPMATASNDTPLRHLLLKVHEYFDAGRRLDKWSNVLLPALFVLIPLSTFMGGFFLYFASTAEGTPNIAWNNPVTFPLAVVFLMMLASSMILVAPIVVLVRFTVKWGAKFKNLRELVKAAAVGESQ